MVLSVVEKLENFVEKTIEVKNRKKNDEPWSKTS